MIKNIYLKYKEIINYLIFGIITTIINLITYYLLVLTILNPNNPLELQTANIISWFITVTVAYITNRIYVFNSKSKNLVKEILKFFSSRIVTLLIEMILMYILVTKLNLNDKIIKFFITIIIVILNYIISKLIIFKNKTKEN